MFKRICCAVICIVLTVTCANISSSVLLAEEQRAYINGSNVRIRTSTDTSDSTNIITQVSYVYVIVNGTTDTGEEYLWYNVTYDDVTGYVYGKYINLVSDEPTPTPTPVPDFETALAQFPESYRAGILALHQKYPNWVFYADHLSMSFEEAVTSECVWPLKLVNLTSDSVSWRSMESGAYDWESGKWANTAGGWTGASREVVEYYMDPRNFLNENGIYIFLKQGYDLSQNAAGVAQIVAGTFLANGYSDPDDTAYGGSYISVIMEAARQSGVSPYVLASTIVQEQGANGTSSLISGTSTYGKYFNFFNIQASGDDVVKSGLDYAKGQGWTTRSASIIGGAKFYAQGYISNGQDTYFYKNFDIYKAPYYTHQYAQAIYDSASSASRIKNIYGGNTNMSLAFRIPVYTSIPDSVAEKPASSDRQNNYYILSADIPDFSMYNFNYAFDVGGDTEINVTLPEGASITTPATNTLSAGINVINVTVRAQTGYTRTYKLNVTAAAPCVLKIKQGTPTGDGGGEVINPDAVKKGDVNGDGVIDVIDLAAVKLYILNKRTFDGDKFNCADTNNDNAVDVIDLAAIKLCILGKKELG